MRHGKYRVQHLSLFSVMVPFDGSNLDNANTEMTEKVPKVPRSPGPKYKRFPLEGRN